MTPLHTLVAAASLSLAACSTPPIDTPRVRDAGPLAWLAGCWVTGDGTSEERWTAGGSGYLFGYSVALNDGEVVFFEQMRIEPAAGGPLLHVYPRGVGPTTFEMAVSGKRSIAFVNADNDYPQRIRYARAGDTLTATISLMDGSRPGVWVFAPCQ
jgi:hypothetical protein